MSNKTENIEILNELSLIAQNYHESQMLEEKIRETNLILEDKKDDCYSVAAKVLIEFSDSQKAKLVPKRPVSVASKLKAPAIPLKVPERKKPAEDIAKATKIGLSIFVLLIGFAICSILMTTSIIFSTLNGFFMIGTLVAVAMWATKGRTLLGDIVDWMEKKEQQKEDDAEWAAAYDKAVTQEANNSFYNDFAKYHQGFVSYTEACNKKHDEELKAIVEKNKELDKKFEKTIEDLEKQKAEVDSRLKSFTALTPAYYELASSVRDMLESGRADTLKEAINLAVAEQQRVEAEAERRAEADRRQAELERQGREAAAAAEAHNRAMERAAEDQARAAREQARAAEDQARAARQQAADAKRAADQARADEARMTQAGFKRCATCANTTKCPLEAKKRGATCGAYKPR